MPAYIIAFIWINYEFEKGKGDYSKYNSYTEFYEKERGSLVNVYLTTQDERVVGYFIGESKKFITIRYGGGTFLIPKDKILYMRKD